MLKAARVPVVCVWRSSRLEQKGPSLNHWRGSGRYANILCILNIFALTTFFVHLPFKETVLVCVSQYVLQDLTMI